MQAQTLYSAPDPANTQHIRNAHCAPADAAGLLLRTPAALPPPVMPVRMLPLGAAPPLAAGPMFLVGVAPAAVTPAAVCAAAAGSRASSSSSTRSLQNQQQHVVQCVGLLLSQLKYKGVQTTAKNPGTVYHLLVYKGTSFCGSSL
jgi:hypothetical protein